jgi:hypothetical protein
MVVLSVPSKKWTSDCLALATQPRAKFSYYKGNPRNKAENLTKGGRRKRGATPAKSMRGGRHALKER